MPNPHSAYTVVFGGWYQRTTLHLTEIYDFLEDCRGHKDLDSSQLKSFRDQLHLGSISREVGYLEYIQAEASGGISIKYYEDGLYVLSQTTSDILTTATTLEHYFRQFFEPAISYLFSRGAPIPKVLANIKTFHPIVVETVY